MMTFIIFIGLAVFTLIFFFVIYNGLVTLKNNVARAWSNIDVLLKQRYDELPKLIAICERYLKHEEETLENITKARSMVAQSRTPEESAQSENFLTGALKSLFAVTENYPELKADRSFSQLQNRISSLENEIADRREYFNDSVNIYNIGIEKLPDAVVASILKYQPKKLWEINPAHRKDVKIEFGV
ncbi:LemA family protein [Gemmatimonas aurantiaca]|nr:LemA family protein [Gemmatimonas aurantiaca]